MGCQTGTSQEDVPFFTPVTLLKKETDSRHKLTSA